jgi:hypothetical protein
MKVKELLNQLKQYDKNLDVIIFAAGSLYAPNGLQIWNEEGKEVLEIGCGWDQIDDE